MSWQLCGIKCVPCKHDFLVWIQARTFVTCLCCVCSTCKKYHAHSPQSSLWTTQPTNTPLVDLKHSLASSTSTGLRPLSGGRLLSPESIGSYASFCFLEYQMPHATCFSHFDFISVQLLIRSVSVWHNLPPVSLVTFIFSMPGRQAAAAVLRCHPVTCSVHLVYDVMGLDEWMASHSTASFMILSSGAVQLWFPSY